MCELISAILGTALFTIGSTSVTVGGALTATALAAKQINLRYSQEQEASSQ